MIKPDQVNISVFFHVWWWHWWMMDAERWMADGVDWVIHDFHVHIIAHIVISLMSLSAWAQRSAIC